MSIIYIEKLNEVYLKVYSDFGIESELTDYFTYEYPGAKFTPAYRARLWNGKVYLYNQTRKTIYVGLFDYIIKFAEANGYTVKCINTISNKNDIDYKEIELYAQNLNLHARGVPIDIREYQLDAIHFAINNYRTVLLSPTGSGKSLCIYILCRWLLDMHKRLIIIVPTTSLCYQMKSDFEDYSSANGWNAEDHVSLIMSGFTKDTETNVVISTWQSIHKQPKEWFDQFDAVLVDECLHPDTFISMSDGTRKKIKDVLPGDLVLTFNEDTCQIESKPVVKIHHNISINEQMYELCLNNNETIKITGNHKVLLTTGEWKRVDELKIGDIINSLI